MGNGLPAAIGGAYATGKKVVCVMVMEVLL